MIQSKRKESSVYIKQKSKDISSVIILFKTKVKVTKECVTGKIKDMREEEYYLFSVYTFIIIGDTKILLFRFCILRLSWVLHRINYFFLALCW